MVFALLQNPAAALNANPTEFIQKTGVSLAPEKALAYAVARVVTNRAPAARWIAGLSELQKNAALLLATLTPTSAHELLKKIQLPPEGAPKDTDQAVLKRAPVQPKYSKRRHRPISQVQQPDEAALPSTPPPAPLMDSVVVTANTQRASPAELKGLTTAGAVMNLLMAKGWTYQKSNGSHNHFTHPEFPGIKITVPGTGSSTIKPGTLNDILKQASLK
jgi:predicted RNA binding protein YcfA (HicA-like mRNA interferase family)